MNFMEYVCRGIVRSEDAIARLNKNVRNMAKCCKRTNVAVACIGVGCLLFGAVVAIQDQEIKALQKQVAELAANDESESLEDTTTEEQNQQEGA